LIGLFLGFISYVISLFLITFIIVIIILEYRFGTNHRKLWKLLVIGMKLLLSFIYVGVVRRMLFVGYEVILFFIGLLQQDLYKHYYELKIRI
jgi:hypothetical protein